MLIARNIKRAMEDQGVSQLELGRRTGMKRQQVAQYMHGDRTPKPLNLKRIALALGLPMDWFLEPHDQSAVMSDLEEDA